MNIVGAPNLSDEEVALKITEGHRLVSFSYCVSIIVLTFRRSSDLYLLKPHESGRSLAFGYGLISFVVGWWGIPWGPIYTIASLADCLTGGKDHSQDFLKTVLGSFTPADGSAPPPLSLPTTDDKTPGLAVASLCLGIAGILPLGIIGAIPAIICGHIALSRIKRNQGTKGKRLAGIGLILGYLVVVFTVVIFATVILRDPATSAK
jgi:Domain of unknown function (DUF4190)